MQPQCWPQRLFILRKAICSGTCFCVVEFFILRMATVRDLRYPFIEPDLTRTTKTFWFVTATLGFYTCLTVDQVRIKLRRTQVIYLGIAYSYMYMTSQTVFFLPLVWKCNHLSHGQHVYVPRGRCAQSVMWLALSVQGACYRVSCAGFNPSPGQANSYTQSFCASTHKIL